MRIVQINATCGKGGTGKIALAVSELLDKNDVENYILYSCEQSDHKNGIKFASKFSIKIHALLSRIAGNYGFENRIATRKIISHLERIKPDIVHLHNVHSHDCELSSLIRYIKAKGLKVYWTFHDCWMFTGYCPYFDMVDCDQWKTGCKKCPQRKLYSWFFDRSNVIFNKKKKLFDGLDVTIITPSQWLCDLIKESCLKDCPVKVINNGIDLSVFKPRKSDFREKYHCENKYILLGVSFRWEKRKGLDVFQELARRLDDRYQIVLVGTNHNIESCLPDNVISIGRTNNQAELAEIYSAADLFVNPTREDNYPTVNMEALACGTPVITFKTGGSSEMIDDTCGSVIPKDDVEAFCREIVRISEEKPYSAENCLKKAKSFDEQEKFQEYIALYNR